MTLSFLPPTQNYYYNYFGEDYLQHPIYEICLDVIHFRIFGQSDFLADLLSPAHIRFSIRTSLHEIWNHEALTAAAAIQDWAHAEFRISVICEWRQNFDSWNIFGGENDVSLNSMSLCGKIGRVCTKQLEHSQKHSTLSDIWQLIDNWYKYNRFKHK